MLDSSVMGEVPLMYTKDVGSRLDMCTVLSKVRYGPSLRLGTHWSGYTSIKLQRRTVYSYS